MHLSRIRSGGVVIGALLSLAGVIIVVTQARPAGAAVSACSFDSGAARGAGAWGKVSSAPGA